MRQLLKFVGFLVLIPLVAATILGGVYGVAYVLLHVDGGALAAGCLLILSVVIAAQIVWGRA